MKTKYYARGGPNHAWTCGHHHRTPAAAERCRSKMQRWECINGSMVCDADWFNSSVMARDDSGERHLTYQEERDTYRV